MSIGSGVPYNVHTGNGVTTTFAYGFTVLAAADLVATVAGVTTSVTVNNVGVAAGGTVVFASAPANGAEVILRRVLTLTRLVEYQTNGDLLAATINADLDRLLMLVQGVNADTSRSLRAPFPETMTDLPAKASRIDKLLSWNASGNPIAVAPVAGTATALALELASTASASFGDALVGVKRTAIGAAATTLHAWIERQPLFVKADFGAVLDGVADDATAVQSAFTAANASGRRVVFDGPSCKIGSALSQSNHAHYDVDWGACQVSYTGGVSTYMLDMTQAGRIRHTGGVFTGSGSNHLLKTRGSTAAQATTYPTIPAEAEWTRQCEFHPIVVTGFATVFDLQNFTREFWLGGCITGNTTAVKITGKVVNVYAQRGTVLYSAVAASQALLVRGDSGDTAYRYAEGLFFAGAIMDTRGTTVDARDFYLLDISGAQIKTAAAGYAVDVTKGICPITRELFIDRALMQGKLRFGTGLAAAHLFSAHGSSLSFSDVDGTAINIEANTKGVTINGASFNSPTGTARMFAVGAGCVSIKLTDLNPDPGTYTNAPTIDATSLTGVEAEFTASFTPGVAFGGSSTGITYSTQSGRYYYRGGHIYGSFEITLTNKGAQVGAATITGLPFVCKLVNGAATVGKYSSMNTAFTPILDITKETGVINIKSGAGGSEAAFTNTDFANGTLINGSFSYPVS